MTSAGSWNEHVTETMIYKRCCSTHSNHPSSCCATMKLEMELNLSLFSFFLFFFFPFFFFVFHPRYSFKIPERIKILWTLTIWWIVAQVSCHLDIRVVSSLSWKMNFFPSGTLNRSMLDAFVKHSFIRTLIPKYDRTQRFLESDDSSRTTQIRGVGRGNWTRLEYEKICNSRKESS